jgi:hypothetical protein
MKLNITGCNSEDANHPASACKMRAMSESRKAKEIVRIPAFSPTNLSVVQPP